MLDWDILFKYSVHERKALFAVGLGDKNNHDLVHIFFKSQIVFFLHLSFILLDFKILLLFYQQRNQDALDAWMLDHYHHNCSMKGRQF